MDNKTYNQPREYLITSVKAMPGEDSHQKTLEVVEAFKSLDVEITYLGDHISELYSRLSPIMSNEERTKEPVNINKYSCPMAQSINNTKDQIISIRDMIKEIHSRIQI